MHDPQFLPLDTYRELPEAEMTERARTFLTEARRRRTVREFSSRPVARQIIEDCLLAAGTAPSGANQQPWHFVAVSDPEMKSRVRVAAEKEERSFYGGRAPEEWLQAVAPFGTDDHKPFLEIAPYLIAIFGESYQSDEAENKVKNYYVTESVGIATGILITALHNAGLATLTHTPSPLGFLNEILGRPKNERPFLLVVAGYPAEDAMVPAITKKTISEIATFL